jgi:hypothetical protein
MIDHPENLIDGERYTVHVCDRTFTAAFVEMHCCGGSNGLWLRFRIASPGHWKGCRVDVPWSLGVVMELA